MTEEVGNRDHSGDHSDERTAKLIDRLNSLKDGSSAVIELVACGRKAIEPLRRFLLDGKPSGIYHPRQHAVEALGELGAKDVLIEYLAGEKEIPDPVARYGEEAVENTAARLLAAWRDEDTYKILLWLLRRKALPGLIDAVGEFRRADAIPELIAALGDSIGRSFAEEALRKLGEDAHRALIRASRTPHPSADYESSTSLYRRRSALRLLSELRLSEEDWHDLSPLADDGDREIAARAGRIALAVAEESEKKLAVRRLIKALPDTSWSLQIEIESWLVEGPDITRAAIDEEIARRRAAVGGRSTDEMLHRLLALKQKIERTS